jgi:hypothetical protein
MKSQMWSQQQFEQLALERAGSDYKIIGEYQGSQVNIDILHITCNTLFKPKPDDFLGHSGRHGTRCPNCSHRSVRYSTPEFSKKVIELTNGDYNFVDTYTTTHDKKKFLHVSCGNVFVMRPNNFLIKGNRCPICTVSKGEDRIRLWLNNQNAEFDEQFNHPDMKSRAMKFDFRVHMLDDTYVLIEFDGRLHFEPYSKSSKSLEKFKKTQEADKYKTQFCIDNNIILYRIHYDDLDNIEQVLSTMFND